MQYHFKKLTFYLTFCQNYTHIMVERMAGEGKCRWINGCNYSVAKSCSALYNPLVCSTPGSMGFSRQEYQNGLPFPSPGDLPGPGIKPTFLALANGIFTAEPPVKPGQMARLNNFNINFMCEGFRGLSVALPASRIKSIITAKQL